MPHGLINDLDADVLAKKLTRLKGMCFDTMTVGILDSAPYRKYSSAKTL